MGWESGLETTKAVFSSTPSPFAVPMFGKFFVSSKVTI